MKSSWQKYLLYASIVIVGGYILFESIRLKNTGFEGKSLWDWMELLIIPAVLAGGAFYLNRSERNTEREIAADRQQEAALQSYLDRMSDLLLKEKLRTSKNKEVRNVATIRTLAILRGLDTFRKGLVINFLLEAGLINEDKTVIDLRAADLRGANLIGANLTGVRLAFTDLRGANLLIANLRDANLMFADLKHAKLAFTDLNGANLKNAHLIAADLTGADLESALLEGAQVTDELARVKSLKGAIMPDGTKHK